MSREDAIMKLCEDSGFEIKDVDLEDLEYGEMCYLPFETDEKIAELILKDIKTKR